VLGDINAELITTYLEIRDHVEAVIQSLIPLPCGEPHYYHIRAVDPESLPRPDRAARFIYLNRLCFNGLYRTNLRGEFNVPYGGERSGRIPSADVLRACAASLRGATLMACSFEETLNNVRQGDFVYLDPPYCIRSRRVFNEYSKAGFGAEQLLALRNHLQRLDGMGVPFLVSYGHSREALELGDGFHCRHTVVQRQIAGFAADRRKSREVVITNF
jgi:DNA adenine methylase